MKPSLSYPNYISHYWFVKTNLTNWLIEAIIIAYFLINSVGLIKYSFICIDHSFNELLVVLKSLAGVAKVELNNGGKNEKRNIIVINEDKV